MQDAFAFESFYVGGGITHLGKNFSVILSEQRSELSDSRWCSAKSRRRARLPDLSNTIALMFFEDLVLEDLSILKQVESAQHWSGWNIVGQQTRQDVIRSPFLPLGGRYLAPLDSINC